MGTWGSFWGGEAASEADHSPPSSEEVKNVWSYTSTPQYAFMGWCSVTAQRQLYLCLYLPPKLYIWVACYPYQPSWSTVWPLTPYIRH